MRGIVERKGVKETIQRERREWREKRERGERSKR